MSQARPTGEKIFTPPVLAGSVVVLIAIYFLVLRFIYGIGPVSNLTDHQAWGIWKVVGVMLGAGLVNGGYVTALVVYILNRGHYHRFVGQAVLISLLGYSFAGFSLLYDVGRYWGLFNFFIPKYWQPNSVLFEVAICILAYTFILVIEVLPILLRKFFKETDSNKNLAKRIHDFLDKILFLTVAFGVLLPTMHQSGLGGLAVILGKKLSPLWQTPFISLLYVISAISLGLAVVVAVECTFADTLKDRKYRRLLSMMTAFWRNIAVVFILFRWVEIVRAGGTYRAFIPGLEAASFWVEMGLAVGGILLVSKKQNLRSPRVLFIASILMLCSGLLYRFNTYIIGFTPAPGVSYFPSFPEFMISAGMYTLQIIIFLTVIKIFPVLTNKKQP